MPCLTLDGLAIHNDVAGRYGGPATAVSHLPSGLRLATLDTHQTARRFLSGLLDMNIDWTADKETINRVVLGNPTTLKAILDLKREMEP